MSETLFVGAGAEPVVAAQVPLPRPWRGRAKLVKMLSAAVDECLGQLPPEDRMSLPAIIGIAERNRPGGPDGVEELIISELEAETGLRFSREHTTVLPLGRASGVVALQQARTLIERKGLRRVLVAGVDSLLVGRLLTELRDGDRLLSEENSNGFIPGEAAGCILLDVKNDKRTVVCTGVGVSEEPVTFRSEEPFRAEGLTRAITAALAEANLDLSSVGVRLTDLSGEHYYFREAALALSRLLRQDGCRELWHPADCIGEVGAAIGPILIGYAMAAAQKDFLPGPNALVQTSSDEGMRAVACLSVVEGANVE